MYQYTPIALAFVFILLVLLAANVAFGIWSIVIARRSRSKRPVAVGVAICAVLFLCISFLAVFLAVMAVGIAGGFIVILLGSAVLILPGIAFLTIFRRKWPGELDCQRCCYDLRGCTGSTSCPECGEAIPAEIQKRLEMQSTPLT